MTEEQVPDEGTTKKNTKWRQTIYLKKLSVMTVKRIQNLGKRMEAQTKKTQEMFNEEPDDIKNKQSGKCSN